MLLQIMAYLGFKNAIICTIWNPASGSSYYLLLQGEVLKKLQRTSIFCAYLAMAEGGSCSSSGQVKEKNIVNYYFIYFLIFNLNIIIKKHFIKLLNFPKSTCN